ncbi:MAG: hypothetical protein JRI22_02425 [Deltaproteobacteria bacterium]|nr:hypothetical protein [Deltaproteobacteria bacterium]
MIRSVSVMNVHLPLRKPFQLLEVDFHVMEFTLVILEQGHRTGVGALTVFPGYSDTTMDNLWQFARGKGGVIIGEDPRWALGHLSMESDPSLLCATPFIVALEALLGSIPEPDMPEYPLSGRVLEDREPHISEEVISLLEQGFRTLRVEGGSDVEADIQRVKRIRSLAGQTTGIRLDAHEGYSFDEARHFLEGVESTSIELLEQPFPREEWEKTATLAEWSPIPIMLDESIRGEEDLKRAASMGCCQYVKCNLMRSCSFGGLIQHIQRSRELGFQVVVGNDVGCEMECYYEAMAAAFLGVRNSGDMNGFLLQREPLLERPLSVRHGCLVPPPEGISMLNHTVLERYVVNRIRWAAARI